MKKNLCQLVIMLSRYFLYGFLIQFFAFNTLFGKSGAAQLNTPIHAHLQNISLSQVFDIIKKESGFTFVYDAKDINSSRQIDIPGNNLKVRDILDVLASKFNFSFKTIGNTITVKAPVDRPNDFALPKIPLATSRQPVINYRVSVVKMLQFQVSGKVTDSAGAPLIGVTVQVKGSKVGATTDAQGHFEIDADQNAVLVFSYVGYQNKEVPVNGRKQINVTLSTSATGLNEVVVVGYGTEKKIDLTGAIDQISGKKLQNRPITNLGNGLEGLIPNLNVGVGDGQPGTGTSFNIRGITSVNGGGPLVLVDGVEMNPNLISPADVASVTVLKDAASAAIYGSRAAYGVVLITTKKPTNNSPLTVSYSASYTITRPTRMPQYLNSLKYVQMHMQADHNGQVSGGSTASNPFTELDSTHVVKYFNDPKNNLPVYVDPNNPNLYRYVGNTDWIKEEYPGWAPMTDHNITLQGGGDKTSYLASMDYFSQEGLAKANDEVYRRYNPTIKVNSDVTSWLNLNFKATLNRTEHNTAAPTHPGSAASLIFADSRPTMPVYHPDGNFSGQGAWSNPIAIALQNGRDITQTNDLWLTGGFELKPINHVTVNGNFNWEFYQVSERENWKEFPEYGVNGVFLDYFPWTIPDAVQNTSENDKYTTINLYAQYENTFGKHYFKAMIGYNQESKQYSGFFANAKNLIDQDIPAINLNDDPKPSVGGNQSAWAIVGTFFRLNYHYNDKYLLEVNGRYDGSSRFSSEDRYVFSPSVSAGWRISKEPFFEPLTRLINDLKLRLSYGVLGNQSLNFNAADVASNSNLYPYLATLPVGSSGYIFGNQLEPTVAAPGLVSNNFTWEKVGTKDAGIDFTMFNQRLSTTFDYYIRNTTNMVVPGQPLPAVLGTSAPSKNAADLRTQGWELSISWQDRINQDWSYSVGLALSDYTARITKYDLNPNKIISSYYPGDVFGEIWGFVTQGFVQDEHDAQTATQSQSQLYGGQWIPGDILYKDLDGDGKITYGDNTVTNPGDQKIIGNSTPRYQYGLDLSVTYKNFDFTALLQGIGKRDFMPGGSAFWGFTSEWSVPYIWNANYWTPEHTNAYFPALRFGGGGNFLTQTKYLQNAAYMRLKNISLGYNFPPALLKRIGIRALRVYISGANVFEITNLYKAYDPEVTNYSNAYVPNGLNALGYPINRAYSAGLQITL